ncbi:hypothetical protein BDR22DRAFT_892978 [Usnea florida]
MPEKPPSSSLPIHAPSDRHQANPYNPPFRGPPSGPLDSAGLKARIEYGNKLRKNRDITPRTMRFIQWWKDRCAAMLEAAPFHKKKIQKEVEILDDEMASRYEKIHGHEGLCHTLVEQFNAMAEIRMMTEYGDYLAYTYSGLKAEEMNDMIRKIDKLDWQAVAETIKQEEDTLADEKRRRVDTSPTPYLDEIAKAANGLGYQVDMIRYQILAYADRNNFCHSGLKVMIQEGLFQQLAERIMEDKRALVNIFRGEPSAQIEIRKMIKFVEKEWFVNLWVHDTNKGKDILYLPSEKALKKMKSTAPPPE